MVRYFSFIVLIAVIVLLIVLFYKVMVGFFVPLFLALIATILFQPLHFRILELCRGRVQWAAMITTIAIMTLVLVPLVLLLSLAVAETRTIVQRFSPAAISTQLAQVRTSAGLDIPAATEFFELENSFIALANTYSVDSDEKRRRQLNLIQQEIRTFAEATGRQPTAEVTAEEVPDPWQKFLLELAETKRLLLNESLPNVPGNAPLDNTIPENTIPENTPPETGPLETGNGISSAADSPELINQGTQALPASATTVIPPQDQPEDVEVLLLQQVRATIRAWDAFKHQHCGGRTWSWLKILANPTADQSEEYMQRIVTWAREQGLSLTGATTAFVGNTLLGITIMVVAIYFFLLDGPQMIAAVRKLSPLDDEHEQQLLQEFSRVSRAVVLATLLAAIVQGLLAGAGFIVFGVDNVFLLTALTIALAMIPFVGAAAVWAPVAISLYLFDGRPTAAIGLALYGSLIISTSDNIVKPMVLHGQSNLHPLFALLSVLGGVTALGPIGILIGPMITAFLQTLLEILQRELTRLPAPSVGLAPAGGVPESAIASIEPESSSDTSRPTASSPTASSKPQPPQSEPLNRPKTKRGKR